MKIFFNTAKSPNFGTYVSPRMKYKIIKETKKFYNRKQAQNIINLIQNSSDEYNLNEFTMSMPGKREKRIFCDIFITSKNKNGKNYLIHTYLGKFKDKNIKWNSLSNIIKKI